MKIHNKLLVVSLMLILVFSLTGCEPEASIGLRLIKPEPIKSDPTRYKDNKIDIKFKPYNNVSGELEAVMFELENVSDSTIKVIWNEVTFVSPDKTTSRVIHKGIKFINSGESMPPSTIPTNSKLIDNVSPSDNVYWNDEYSSWSQEPIAKVNKDYYKEKISIILPLKIGEKKKDYRFDLEVLIIKNKKD